MKGIVIFFFGWILSSLGFAQITMTSGLTADQAVQYLLGPTVAYSNATFTGSGLQLGQLDGLAGAANFGIGSGIVLCTDDVVSLTPSGVPGAITPNISVEPDLLEVAQSVPPMINQNFTITNVNNVAILEFDFVATGNNLSFNYIFGSNEYLTFVNTQYNDVFAFFLSGPGITGPYASPAAFPGGAINIAAVPNSNPPLPITISSVNNVLNAQYYIDNQTQVDISSNGYTAVLEAQSPIQCGQTYHIKLAIADCGDQSLQSFVCLEAGSFNVGTNLIQPIAVTTPGQSPIPGFPANAILEGESCYDGIFVLSPPPCALEPDTIQIVYSGSATLGSDYTTGGITEIILYPNQPDTLFLSAFVDNVPEGDDSLSFSNVTSGYETITLSFIFENPLDSGDLDTASATLLLIDYTPITIDEVADAVLCSGSPVVLDEVQASIENGVPAYTYRWEGPAGDQISTNAILTLSDTATVQEGAYWVTVTDFCGNKDSSEFNIIVPDQPDIDSVRFVQAVANTLLCSGSNLQLIVVPSHSNNDYNWYFVENEMYVPFGTENDTLTLSAFDQTFWVVETEPGCNYRDTANYDVTPDICEITIPNLITPNAEGSVDSTDIKLSNNSFYVDNLTNASGISAFPNSTLTIYNRWGIPVYESADYRNDWTAKDLAEGTYYYVFKWNKTPNPEYFQGYIQVVREK
jgi:hypothetical protein